MNVHQTSTGEKPRYAVLEYMAVDLTNKVCINPYDP